MRPLAFQPKCLRLRRHCEGVAATAQALAPALGVDPQQAWLAGWLHDCAKEMAPAQARRLLDAAGADSAEKALPALWHAPLGALLARRRHGVADRRVLSAIRWHSTGRAGMGALERLLFLADYIEPNRDFPGLKALRKLALRDVEQAFAQVAALKLAHLVAQRRIVHPRTLQLYNSLLKNPA
jgi:predicted HD superfamily hydrolase involved in NAD metabolism